MRLIRAAVALETLTGVLLIGAPSLLGRLILGTKLPGSAQAIGRLAGIALLALSAACWPERKRKNEGSAVRGLLLYNVLVTIFFASLKRRGVTGPLLWPVIAVHAILSILFVRRALTQKKP